MQSLSTFVDKPVCAANNRAIMVCSGLPRVSAFSSPSLPTLGKSRVLRRRMGSDVCWRTEDAIVTKAVACLSHHFEQFKLHPYEALHRPQLCDTFELATSIDLSEPSCSLGDIRLEVLGSKTGIQNSQLTILTQWSRKVINGMEMVLRSSSKPIVPSSTSLSYMSLHQLQHSLLGRLLPDENGRMKLRSRDSRPWSPSPPRDFLRDSSELGR